MTEWAHTESTGGDEIIEHPECSRKAHNHYQYGVDEQKKTTYDPLSLFQKQNVPGTQ